MNCINTTEYNFWKRHFGYLALLRVKPLFRLGDFVEAFKQLEKEGRIHVKLKTQPMSFANNEKLVENFLDNHPDVQTVKRETPKTYKRYEGLI